jgi:FkbM family methyltransferase
MTVIEVFKKIFKKKSKEELGFFRELAFRFMPSKSMNKTSLLGHTFKYNFHHYWFRHTYKEIFEDKSYMFAEPSDKKFIILDCGSNVGISLVFFIKFYPNAIIEAFEPDPINFSILKENLSYYDCNALTIHNKGVWTNESLLKFDAQGGMGSGIMTDVNNMNAQSIDIEVVRLKDIISKYGSIDFIKLDIEGAEFEVLKDCLPVLSKVKAMFVEFHCNKTAEQKLDEFLLILKNAGFRYYLRQAYENLELPFIQKHGEYMDIQLNIFCFRD